MIDWLKQGKAKIDKVKLRYYSNSDRGVCVKENIKVSFFSENL